MSSQFHAQIEPASSPVPAFAPASRGLLQRKCACGGTHGVDDMCEACRGQRLTGVQTKLRVNEPGDRYEQEADRIADEVMRMPEPTVQREEGPEEDDEDETLQMKPLATRITPLVQREAIPEDEDEEEDLALQRQALTEEEPDEEEEEEVVQTKRVGPKVPTVTSSVEAAVQSVLQGGGKPLDSTMRAFMEPRFGHDFGDVRIHNGPRADVAARAVNARAFTVDRCIVFARGELQLDTPSGRRLLAHELTHTVQQGKRADAQALRPAGDVRRTWTSTVMDGLTQRDMTGGGPIDGHGPAVAEPRAEHPGGLLVQRVTGSRPDNKRGREADTGTGPIPVRFSRRLGRDPEQKAVLTALFNNREFSTLWNWLGNCGQQKRDHGPIDVRVRRVKRDGIEIFGEFNETRGTLIVNPKKLKIVDNPQELVDTIVHEVIHAISWAHRTRICPEQDATLPLLPLGKRAEEIAGREPAPDPRALVTVKDKRAEGSARPEDPELKSFHVYGPSASDPCRFFQDIRAEHQQAIIRIVSANISETKIGRRTLTFVNQILREDITVADPEVKGTVEKFRAGPVLEEFRRCRDEACFKGGKCTRAMIEEGGGELCPLRPRRQRERDMTGCMENVLKDNVPMKFQKP
jgi:hypothetical protein